MPELVSQIKFFSFILEVLINISYNKDKDEIQKVRLIKREWR